MVALHLMVCDWRVLRAAPMLSRWPNLQSCVTIGRKAVEFDPDQYQKFKYHRYVQKSYVPTPHRAPITTWEQTQTFLIKNSTFDRQFLQNVKEFDLFQKHVN